MLRAVIFDFDGVIVDTERFHFQALKRVLDEERIPLTWDEYIQHYLALDDKNCLRTVLSRHAREVTPQILMDLTERKAAYFFTHAANSVVLFPGVEGFVLQAAARHPLAIASGALREEIEFLLAQVDLREYFPVLVAAEDVEKGKPDPEAYLTALARLNRLGSVRAASPSECLVIEDSRHGVAAAAAAGMRCLAVANSYPPEELTAADLVVKSLEEVGLTELEALFA
jgi:HAD superfamily hydrolase (TIGR01509 family)